MKNTIVYTILCILISACSTVQKPVEQAPPVAVGNGWKSEWSSIVETNVTDNMLAYNLGVFCPKDKLGNGTGTGKRILWLNFIKAIAWAESSWNPNEYYRETTMGIDPVTGRQVASEGLMQLSYQDKANYKSVAACQKIDYKLGNIQDVEINLSCSLGIMSNLISRGVPLYRYWSSLNPAKPGYARTMAKLRELQPNCLN